MKINYKHTTIILGVLVIMLTSVVAVLAGNTDSPGGPTEAGSQMYTLEQIYDRLTTGAAATKMTAFTEPSIGPGSTMHTLDDIWEATKSTYTRVPKTGQAACYKSASPWGTCTCGTANCPSGQDGEYQLGVSPEQEPVSGITGAYTVYGWGGTRFTDNGDGTVSDNLTGLIWLKNANCWGGQTWANALSNANGLADGSCGLSDGSSAGDWRLPNVNELHSLIDLTQSGPALPSGHPFTGVRTSIYWSSTSHVSIQEDAWYVSPGAGMVHIGVKSRFDCYVWPVRGGQ
jgi:hypothetical protein